MMKDIGVKVETNRYLGLKDLTLSKLTNEMDHKAVFIGIGNPEPKIIPIFEGLSEEQGFYTSKSFLPKVAKASKPGKIRSSTIGFYRQMFSKLFYLYLSNLNRSCSTLSSTSLLHLSVPVFLSSV